MASIRDDPTLEEPFWNDEMKEQCDQAKSFWKLWIGRQCGKCLRFHVTEEEIEILKEHKENFDDSRTLFLGVHKLLAVDIANRTEYYETCRIRSKWGEMHESALFTMDVKKKYRHATEKRRKALWEYQCKTEQLGVEMDDIADIKCMIDALAVDVARGVAPAEGECAKDDMPEKRGVVQN
ncbi:hypothetical protein VC83_07751 [Pseudogymnoascus destructans]|uniref:Uncharacterized protein n=2 Tax=Pseudogymnoascus destructans TaxID=655981 RepID=L8G3N5_PSED2|nr:uncharacterized protein VC83_07751 [Pseudogymnoascus destructans]ELR07273.1 hypothetical protein GMDG_08344 [Pseudogymnoascus destructans 20631-21]OAF55698.1 hypothetical protein VC83_07751 [Pseudogymnoascus destructans]